MGVIDKEEKTTRIVWPRTNNEKGETSKGSDEMDAKPRIGRGKTKENMATWNK